MSSISPATQEAKLHQELPETTLKKKIESLKLECASKHKEAGLPVSRFLLTASLVAGVYTAIVFGGITGFLLALGTTLISNRVLSSIYNHFRNKDLLHAKEALNHIQFCSHLSQCADVSINTIVSHHKQYKESLVQKIN